LRQRPEPQIETAVAPPIVVVAIDEVTVIDDAITEIAIVDVDPPSGA
jgi:hypothetical protein